MHTEQTYQAHKNTCTQVPHLMKQKRDFILSWWRQAAARQAAARQAHSPGVQAAAPHLAPTSPALRVDHNPLRVYADASPRGVSSETREILNRLLVQYGMPDHGPEGTFELRVPVEHLQIVCSQVEKLTSSKAPRQPRARREWLAAIAAQSATPGP